LVAGRFKNECDGKEESSYLGNKRRILDININEGIRIEAQLPAKDRSG